MRKLKLSAIILACLFGLCPAGSADTPSSISANFNGTALGGSDYIWFSSVLKPSGLGTKAVTIFVRNSTITFSANGTTYTVSVPDSNVTFSPSATSATTSFIIAQNLWQTTVPSSGLAGSILLDAAEFPVPQGGLPGSIQNVTWKSNFSTSDTLSGVADVTCNSLEATISGSNISCNLTLSAGANGIQVQATDVAGNVAMATVNVTYNLTPPPTSLLLTPDRLAMAMSESRKVALVDNLARPIPASTWAVSDPTVAQIASDGTIAPLAAGNVTITATYQSLSATAQLTVYGSQTFPPATVRWTVQPLPGDTLVRVSPGQAAGSDDPDVYFSEKSGSNLVVRAFTSDGRQKWIYTAVPTSTSTASPLASASPALTAPKLPASRTAAGAKGTLRQHGWGKKITALMSRPISATQSFSASSASASATQSTTTLGDMEELSSADTDAGNHIINAFQRRSGGGNSIDNVIVTDSNGNELWRHSIVGGEMGYALHPSGIVYILQADYDNNSTFTLFAFDESTGAQIFSIVLPFSYGGQLQPFPGLPSVFPDGNLYLPVETAADSASPDVLQLLKVSPDGTSAWYPVTTASQCFGPVIEAHEPIPDGQGNILLTWDYFGNAAFCSSNQSGTLVVRMTTSGQILSQYQLPLTRLGSYFSDNDGDAVLGTQHLFVVDNHGQNAVGLNLGTGGIDLNWQPPGGPCTTFPCPAVSIAGVAPGDQLILDRMGNSDGSSTLFALTPNSSSCPNFCETVSTVPNAALQAFDFSGTVFSPTFETFFSTDDFFCMCVIPPSASGGAVTVGGAISAPDPNTTPPPDLLPPWPQVAMSDSRKALPSPIIISPKRGLIGTSVDVIITGKSFGSNPVLKAGTGITVTTKSSSDISISASFAIATSASVGNHVVTVKNSSGFISKTTFFVQVPTFFTPIGFAAKSNACNASLGMIVFYQLADQGHSPISVGGIGPEEQIIDGGFKSDFLPGFATPPQTRSDGTFDDNALALCSPPAPPPPPNFCRPTSQAFRVLVPTSAGMKEYPIKTTTNLTLCVLGDDVIINQNDGITPPKEFIVGVTK